MGDPKTEASCDGAEPEDTCAFCGHTKAEHCAKPVAVLPFQGDDYALDDPIRPIGRLMWNKCWGTSNLEALKAHDECPCQGFEVRESN